MRIKKDGILIIGDSDFCKMTKDALDLISEKDQHNFRRVKKFFRYIIQYKSSGADIVHKVFYVGNKTAFLFTDNMELSLLWYASCIIHDSIHVELFRRFNEGDMNKAERYEIYCCERQIKFLEKIGAPKEVIEMIHTSIKSRYWEKERTW